MLQKIFQLRVCDDGTFKNRKRPCILYQIKRCSGPCVGYIEKKDYKKSVEQAIQFVSGKSRDIQKNLSKEMEVASDQLDFEKASIFRDRIKSLNIIQSSQRINEANLIKKHKPKFNILLKDDKSFPFIFISNKDKWAQVTKHRGKKDKEGFYFGPFASAGTANWTIKMLQKIFQ